MSRKLNFVFETSVSEAKTYFKEHIKEAASRDLEYQLLWKQERKPNSSEFRLGYGINKEKLLSYLNIMYVLN